MLALSYANDVNIPYHAQYMATFLTAVNAATSVFRRDATQSTNHSLRLMRENLCDIHSTRKLVTTSEPAGRRIYFRTREGYLNTCRVSGSCCWCSFYDECIQPSAEYQELHQTTA